MINVELCERHPSGLTPMTANAIMCGATALIFQTRPLVVDFGRRGEVIELGPNNETRMNCRGMSANW